jgi:hypothetical protein
MAWRMVLRHCPARSMIVVGDPAQASVPGSPTAWADALDPLVPGRWRTQHLTVNYRTPRPMMDLATALLPLGAQPSVAARDSDESPWHDTEENLAALVARESALVGDGRVAVIAPASRAPQIAAALSLPVGPDLDAPVTILTPEQSKGLEFDSVLIIDPAAIEHSTTRGPADLYVALTRTTRRLGLVGEMPEALASLLS